ncbi:5272_t:CDS:2, partial [Cetraspora pellucida]
TNKASNKAFDLLMKEEKVDKKVNTSKDNKETCVNLAKVNTTQVNMSQVNKIIVTSQVNSEDQRIIEAQSTNQLVSDTDATPAQEKSQDKSQTTQI